MMPIFDETGLGDSVTEGWRALELFTDRYAEIRIFSGYLNDDPSPKRILFLHGDGGNGKSLLLRMLRNKFCKRLDPGNWEWVKDLPDEEFEEHVGQAEGTGHVPVVLLDFGMPPRGEDRPQEAFSALLMLQRTLSAYGLRFPLYTFACVYYLHETNQLTPERQSALFPNAETGFVSAVIDVISETSYGSLAGAVIGLFDSHLGERFTLYKSRRGLDESQIKAIQRMDPETELIDRLPHLFAQDLNAAISLEGSPDRVALLFDTHEAFWGHERNLSNELYFQRDEWLRKLLGTLELEKGVVAVVAGREPPRWGDASRATIGNEYTDRRLVGNLAEADADQYLECAGISNAAMRSCLLEYAKVAPDQVHPLYLGLCVDVVQTAARQGSELTPEDFRTSSAAADKGAELVDKLLGYADAEISYAVRALSACRAFNKDTYLKLGEELNFTATSPSFDVLVRYSFVWGTERRGEGYYRIHDLVRRLLRDRADALVRRADEALEETYRVRAEAGAPVWVPAEAVYHANRRDQVRSVREWVGLFLSALRQSRYELCRSLLEVRSELLVDDPVARAEISTAAGDFFEFLSRRDEAVEEFFAAIAACSEALREQPERIDAYTQRAAARSQLAHLQANLLKQHPQAVGNYEQSISDYDEALRRANDWQRLRRAFDGKGHTLSGLGDSLLELGLKDQAIARSAEAIASYNEALRLRPVKSNEYDFDHHSFDVCNNKGMGLLFLGRAQEENGDLPDALESYRDAVALYKRLFKLVPDSALHGTTYARNNQGLALQSVGQLEAKRALLPKDYECAIVRYRESVQAYEEAERIAPDLVHNHNNKATVLTLLGELQVQRDQYQEAVKTYTQAVASCDRALEHAPNFVKTLSNKAGALFRLGTLPREAVSTQQAIDYLEAARTIVDQCLDLVPDDRYSKDLRNEIERLIGRFNFNA